MDRSEVLDLLDGRRAAQPRVAWEHVYHVIPILIPAGPRPSGMTRIGYVHLRHIDTGMRWSICIFAGVEAIFARHACYEGHHGLTNTVFFDTEEASSQLLDWALRVWEAAARASQGDLPFVPITVPWEQFHAVAADNALLPNGWGSLPWSATHQGPGTFRSVLGPGRGEAAG